MRKKRKEMLQMIGDQIKKHRKKRGMTQEELGDMIGVTTQAVSKWERGGSPDVELLPKIAGALGITINMLYEQEQIRSLEDALIDEIVEMGSKEGFNRLLPFVWKTMMGLSGLDTAKKGFADDGRAPGELREKNGYHYYARASFDDGMINAKMDSDFRYCFFMPEPENGYAAYFADQEELSETFSVLAEKDVLKILFYMYTRINLPVALSQIAANVGLDVARTEELMDALCRINLACCMPIETENGQMKAYTYYNETVVLPMLCSAREVRDRKVIHWGVWFDRNVPLF